MNVSWAELASEKIEDANVLIKGIPFDGAASVGKGACQAPDMIRQLSKALPPITEEGTVLKNFYVKDLGDFEVDLNWERFYEAIENETKAMFETNKFCLFIGGDHSVSIPLEKAFIETNKGKKIGIIHFDSHSDIIDEYEGHKWSHACTQRRALDFGLEDKGLSLVGIRSWEEEELIFLEEHSDINVVTAARIYEEGINALTKNLTERYQDYDAIYLSIDIDVLDPAYAPGTGTPESGGLSTRQMMQIIKSLFKNLPIKAMDIVEVSPLLDTTNNITSWAALKLMYEAFGGIFRKTTGVPK